jgi:hypothetical protein
MKSKKTEHDQSEYKSKKHRYRTQTKIFVNLKQRFVNFFSYWTKKSFKKQRNWIDLDNASKLFPSVMNSTDTKVFRFTATIKDDIDPELLQMALDQAYRHFPLYRGVLRRGIFWYYYEESDLHPVVQEEKDYPCRSLFHYDEKQLLFRVLYYRNRIHLEVFHALSDGTGASWFLQLLITNYILLRYPESMSPRIELSEEFQQQLYKFGSQLDDSFERYFHKGKNEKSINKNKRSLNKPEKRKWKRVHHIHGLRTQDNRMQIIESEMPVKELLQLAKQRNVTLSVLLTAIFIESIHKTVKHKNKEHSVTISVDDVNYYEYMAEDGFANKLVLDQNGNVTCSMINDQGMTVLGDYDVVPILDKFIENHPDFSYRGAKGILALTGYEGALGYRTDESYRDLNPNYDADIAEAKKVAQALRDTGWEFASHSWGHLDMNTITFESFQQDADLWEKNVLPIIGETDIMIYPFGSPFSWSIEDYNYDNQRFAYLKQKGFDYFCTVDGSKNYTTSIKDDFLLQGRRNLDGYRMYYNPELLDDLIDTDYVLDETRPLPVPPL